jgi:isochorismate hydrolase
VVMDTNLMLSLVTGSTATVLAQELASADPFVERLGVAGLLVMAAFFMLRYFMGVVDKKDQQIKELVENQQESLKDNSDKLVAHIQVGYTVQQKTADALNELTRAIREGKLVR